MGGIINALPGALSQGLIWGLLALGVYITYKILDFSDLSVDGSICLGAVVCTILISNGVNVYLALLISFIAGSFAGLLTGLFHTLLGITPILSGILTQLILWSVNLKILGKANVSIPFKVETILSVRNPLMASLVGVIFVALIIVGLVFFFKTEVGHSIRATGSNPDMSKTLGINNDFTKILALMLSNGIVALSGALLAQYQGYADVGMGRGAIVIGLAAVIIGDAIIKGFKGDSNMIFNFIGVIIGSVIYWMVYTIIIQLGLDTDLLKMLSALLVALFLGIPHLKEKYFSKKNKLSKVGGLDAKD